MLEYKNYNIDEKAVRGGFNHPGSPGVNEIDWNPYRSIPLNELLTGLQRPNTHHLGARALPALADSPQMAGVRKVYWWGSKSDMCGILKCSYTVQLPRYDVTAGAGRYFTTHGCCRTWVRGNRSAGFFLSSCDLSRNVKAS